MLELCQGAFALCRVIKRNGSTQKIHDSSREPPKGKKVSGNSGGSSLEIPNDPARTSYDISSQESHYSSPVSPLNEISPVTDFGLGPLENNSESSWVLPDLILDSSKVPELKSRFK